MVAGNRAPVVRDSNFFLPAALVLLLLVMWGFGARFYWAFATTTPHHNMLTDRGRFAQGLFLIHGLVFSAWMLLYVAQSGLVATRRIALHRRLGQATAVVAPAVVVLGIATGIEGARVGFHNIGPIPTVAFGASSILIALNFGLLVWLGWARRSVPAAHRRWMLLATMTLVGAAVARIGAIGAFFPVWFDATALLLPALALWDLATLRRVHPVTLWGGAIYLLVDIGAIPLASSAPGMALIRMVTG